MRFPVDSRLPDPFDGAIAGAPGPLQKVHACLGCALSVGGTVVGALTADGLEANSFDHLDQHVLATLGALAGAAMRTTALIEALEQRAAHRGRVARELVRTAAEMRGGEILGASPAVTQLRREIALVAASDLAVLITGETGVGKELVAHHVHAASARADEAMIHVNCAALPLSIAESELFGHVTGSFTGASSDRAGKFEVADGGTLFLDEIGELSLEIQPKLLRVLQHGEIQRVGSDKVHRVNVRVVAATNRNLAREVEVGALPRRSLSPPGGVSPARPAVARTADRHSGAGGTLCRHGGAPARARVRARDGSRQGSCCRTAIGRATCASWKTW